MGPDEEFCSGAENVCSLNTHWDKVTVLLNAGLGFQQCLNCSPCAKAFPLI